MQVPKERAPVPPTPVTLSKLLLVEGATCWHFFEALAAELGLSTQIEIRDYGGITELSEYLKLIASTSDFHQNVKSLGIARDAEEDAQAARRSVEQAIAGATLPPEVRSKVFIIPDGAEKGMIETVMLQSLNGNPILRCAEEFFECTKASGFTLPAGIVAAKHLVHVYVSTMPVKKMMSGIAAYEGAYPWGSSCFDSMKAFLQGL